MRPLVPVLLAFISGMVFSERVTPSSAPVYVLIGISFCVLLWAYLKGLRFKTYITVPAFFLIGALFIIPLSKAELPPWHIKNVIETPVEAGGSVPAYTGYVKMMGFGRGVFDVKGVAVTEPEFDGRRTRLIVEATEVLIGGEWRGVEGKVRVTVEGEAGEDYRPGDRLRMLVRLKETQNFGNPGEFDYKRRLNFRSIYATGYVKHGRFIIKTDSAGDGFAGYIYSARNSIRAFIDGSGVRNAAAFKALVLGERAGVDPGLREVFIGSGTAHILAISGLHVGIIAFAAYLAVLTFLKLSTRLMLAVNVRKVAAVLTVPVVLFYGSLAGFTVSTQRSVVMAMAVVFTVLINRGREYYNILALAALSVLLFEPYALWDASFQLTFAAVLAILYLTPCLSVFNETILHSDPGVKCVDGRAKTKKIRGTSLSDLFSRRRLAVWLTSAFIVTTAATIGTYPVLAYHFNRLSLVGPLANLLAVPVTGLVVPLLFIASAAQFLWGGVGTVFLYAADAIFTQLVLVLRFFSTLPFASIDVTTPTILEIVLFYLLAISAVSIKGGRIYRYLLPAVIVLLFADYGYWRMRPLMDKELRATFISVGQGDSTLIEFPGGRTMLIDGGGLYYTDFDVGERVLAPLFLYKKIKRLDYVVLSHAQRDHMAGLGYVLENFRVGEFWWNGRGSLRGLDKTLVARGIPVKTIDGPFEIAVNGVEVKALNQGPGKGEGGALTGINDSSLVLRLSYGERRVIFTGDIGRDAEARLIRRAGKEGLGSDVLKAPHHGSRTSSSMAFLKAVSPSMVVVSAGRDNVFGFPHAESLDSYGEMGAKVLRTDLDGAVTISTDGVDLKAVTWGDGDAVSGEGRF